MYPRILHLFGPVWINSYGFMVALGFLVFAYLTVHHPLRKKIISVPVFFDVLFIGLLSGIVGGRLLFVIESFDSFRGNLIEMLYPWVGGFSMLGSIIAILIVIPIYLKRYKVQIFPLLDLASINISLMQSIARIGCFLAGCCHGKVAPESFKFAITYTNPDCLAPLGVRLYPTQFYSSLSSFCIFLIMRFVVSKKATKSGQMLFSYLAMESITRFVI